MFSTASGSFYEPPVVKSCNQPRLPRAQQMALFLSSVWKIERMVFTFLYLLLELQTCLCPNFDVNLLASLFRLRISFLL